MEPLAADPLRRALATLPGWTGNAQGIRKTWRFATFADAIGFMQACVPGIVALDHHPEWSNVFDRVTAILRTHDAGDRVTDADITLARHLDGIAGRFSQRTV